MSTVAEHREEIKELIDDDSFTDDTIDTLINRGIVAASKKVLIPLLETSASVDSEIDTPYIAKPTNYGRNLYAASTPDSEIQVLSSTRLLLNEYPMFASNNEAGPIKHCCVSGSQIAVHPIPPEVTTIKLFFYIDPPILAESDSLDVYIEDEEIQEDVIQNYVLWKIHNKIEDALEGGKPNTMYHKAEFFNALKAFDESITQGQSTPNPHRKSWQV